MRGQQGHLPAPLVPVLRPAVEEEHGLARRPPQGARAAVRRRRERRRIGARHRRRAGNGPSPAPSCRAVRVHVVDPSGLHAPVRPRPVRGARRAGRRDVDAGDQPLRLRRRPAAEGYAVDERFYRLGSAPRGAARVRWPPSSPSTCPTCCATAPRRAGGRRRALPVARRSSRSTCACCRARPAAGPHRPRRPAARAAPGPAARASGACTSGSTRSSCTPSTARARLRRRARGRPERVHVIPHGAFEHLAAAARRRGRCRPSWPRAEDPVVLFFGLLRPYKGIDVLLEAWRGIEDAELWVVGLPRMHLAPLRAAAPRPRPLRRRASCPTREVAGAASAAPTSSCCPTARSTSPACCSPRWPSASRCCCSAVGGFPEVAATGAAELVAPADPAALHVALRACSPTRPARALAAAARERGGHDLLAGTRSPTGTSRSTSRFARQMRAVTALPSSPSGPAAGLLVYAQLGYGRCSPALGAAAPARPRRPPSPAAVPTSSLIVAAYNEAAGDRAKVRQRARARLPAPTGSR